MRQGITKLRFDAPGWPVLYGFSVNPVVCFGFEKSFVKVHKSPCTGAVFTVDNLSLSDYYLLGVSQ